MKTFIKIFRQLLQDEIFYTMPKEALQDVIAYKLLKSIEKSEYEK